MATPRADDGAIADECTDGRVGVAVARPWVDVVRTSQPH